MKYIKGNIKLFIIAAFCVFAVACSGPANTNKPINKKAANATATIPADAPPGAQPPNTLGSSTATVKIEEFADFQCPTCANVYPVMKSALSTYGNRVQFTYHEFPLPMHKNGYDAAVAAEAAGQQGKFWDMQNQLYTNQKSWADSTDVKTVFAEYAEKIGLDVEKFKTDSVSLATKTRVDADMARGRALGVNSTPTIYVNGKALLFEQMTSLDAMKQAIDAELAKGDSQPQTAAPVSSAPASTATNSAAGNTSTAANAPLNK